MRSRIAGVVIGRTIGNPNELGAQVITADQRDSRRAENATTALFPWLRTSEDRHSRPRERLLSTGHTCDSLIASEPRGRRLAKELSSTSAARRKAADRSRPRSSLDLDPLRKPRDHTGKEDLRLAAQRASNRAKLDQVHPPLAVLDIGNERLRPFEPRGELVLRELGFFARGNQLLEKGGIGVGED